MLINDGHGQIQLTALLNYKYSAIDKSPISRYILRHYWEWVARTFIPSWMAPNLITLIGTVGVFLSFVATVRTGQSNSVLCFANAAALWTYSTLDNVDGKQARRTGSSSPLGELFDHGCDALVCGMALVTQLISLDLLATNYALLCTFLTFASFYLVTWEHYWTRTLYLGVINGPTEGIIIACAMYVATGVWGTGFWMAPVANQWRVADVWSLLGILAFCLFAAPCSLHNVYRGSKDSRLFKSALKCAVPFSCLLAGFLFCIHRSLGSLHSTILLLSVLTILFGRLASDIIRRHLIGLPFGCLPVICLPSLSLPFVTLLCGDQITHGLLVCYFVVACCEYALWATGVICSFASFLNIYCFSLKRPVATRGAGPKSD